MKQNVGVVDRFLRLVAAAALSIFYFYAVDKGGWSFLWVLATLLLAATAITGACPFYKIFGINTCVGADETKQDRDTHPRHT